MTKPLPGDLPPPSDPLRAAITQHWLADEATRVRALLADLVPDLDLPTT